MLNVGVDLHKTQMTVCFIPGNNEPLQKVYRTDGNGYEEFCRDIKSFNVSRKKIRIGVETTGTVWSFVKQMEGNVGEIQVINTMKFKVIVESTSKTDKRDARTIAEYLQKDMLPTVTLPDEKSRLIAKYVKVRDRYVKLATRIKNQIHALYAEEGIQIKSGDLTSAIRLRSLSDLAVCEDVQFLLDDLIEELLSLKAKVRKIEKKLDEMTRDDRTVELIRSIPGTGIVNACALRGILSDIKRFDHPKKVAAYAGLVPWVSNSNEKVYHGHITKRGSTILRNAFVQMAMGMIRHWSSQKQCNDPFYNWYQRIVGRTSGGKSKIALARKMSHIVWAILTYNEEFNREVISSRAS
jgi:transposase